MLFVESVAGRNGPTVEARVEPVRALLRGAVSEGFRADVARRHLLQVVVANGRCRAERRFYVAFFEQAALLRGMSPYAGEAVGLEFEFHGERVHFTRVSFLELPNLAFDA